MVCDDTVNITSEVHDSCTLVTMPTKKREKDLTESTGVVPVKNPLKVKLELFSQL